MTKKEKKIQSLQVEIRVLGQAIDAAIKLRNKQEVDSLVANKTALEEQLAALQSD